MRSVLGLFYVCLLVSCSHSTRHENNTTKIELLRYGPGRQVGQISVDSSLIFNYYDCGEYDTVNKVRPIHYYSGKVSTAFWDTLNTKLETVLHNNKIDDETSIGDGSGFELIIHSKGKTTKIVKRLTEKETLFYLYLYG